jgi:tetratricopeptide (TPR) repeat protein
MYNLADTLRAQGDLARARELYERVLGARRRNLGEDHAATLDTMHNLALTLRALGEHAGARKLQERVLAARRRVLGEEHPTTQVSAWNLLRSFESLGMQPEAWRVFADHLSWLPDRDPETLSDAQRDIRERLTAIRDWLGDGVPKS